jgi:hypothetical protein
MWLPLAVIDEGPLWVADSTGRRWHDRLQPAKTRQSLADEEPNAWPFSSIRKLQ